jgi:single-strand DNA-binding protein
MAGINKAIIIGNLGRDPEMRVTQSGKSVCNLAVATERTWNNKQTNERQSETEWHRITVWGAQGENCAKFLSKGRQIYVEGRLRTSSYEKDGVKHYTTEIVAEQVQFLGKKSDFDGQGPNDSGQSGQPAQASSGQSGQASSGQPAQATGGNQNSAGHDPDDDIPF